VGNPYLKPEYTHAFELGYQQSGRFGSIQLSPFFRRTVDAVRSIKTVDDDGVSTVTFQNLATSDSWGSDVNGSVRFGKLSGFAGFSAFKTVTDGSNVEDGLSSDAFSWSARASGTWRITPRLDLTGFYMYRAPMDVERGRISGFSMVTFSARRRLFGNKGNVTLRMMDPFDQMKFSFITSDARHYQESTSRFNMRGVFLSFGFNVGQQPRIRTRAQEPDQTAPDIGIR
jgi:outer membrane receptor protein involved in Fe transport